MEHRFIVQIIIEILKKIEKLVVCQYPCWII